MEETSLLEQQSENFKVFVRIRPLSLRELETKKFKSIVKNNHNLIIILSKLKVSKDRKQIQLYEYYGHEYIKPENVQELDSNPNNFFIHPFSFDYIHDENSTQNSVYEKSAKNAVISIFQGFNSTIMAYGQTGTGKTFTMEGYFAENSRGILPRSIDEIFKQIETNTKNYKYTIKVSYLQIYNETIHDLLASEKANLLIREDKKKGVFVEGLSEWVVNSNTEVFNLIKKGSLMRTTGATKMNDLSSRSHAIFTIIVEKISSQQTDSHQIEEIITGKLNFVDLAGSERIRMTGATGKRLEETKKINQSLSALGNVISALTDPKGNKSHIPYRDSKITRILEDSLGGNCKTVLFTMISPSIDSFFESLCSLKFANRAKNIKNTPIINQGFDEKILELTAQKNKTQNNIEIEPFNEDLNYKIQLDDYKQLVTKQKDVMNALTERLKEKEENLNKMQEELETFDKIHQELQEALNKEKLRGQNLEKILKNNNIRFEEKHRKFKTELSDFDNLSLKKFPEAKENDKTSAKTLIQIKEIKKLVDQVVFDLSTPNDPSRLQNVADDILMIQKIINKLLISEQKERNVFPLKNVTNLIETNNLIKKKINYSVSPMNRNDIPVDFSQNLKSTKNGKENINLKSKKNIFNIIPLRGEININDLINCK